MGERAGKDEINVYIYIKKTVKERREGKKKEIMRKSRDKNKQKSVLEEKKQQRRTRQKNGCERKL